MAVSAKEVKQIVDKSEGKIKKSDIVEYTSLAGGVKLTGVVCRSCGRKRPDDLAMIIPCPGPFDPKAGRSVGGCEDSQFMQGQVLSDYKKEKAKPKPEEKGEEEMAIKTKGKKVVKGKKVKAVPKATGAKKQTSSKSGGSMSDQVLKLVKQGKSRSQIIEITGGKPNTIGSLMYSARKKLGRK